MDGLKAGRAYVRVSLTAARHGLQMYPYSQIIQEYPQMLPLQREFNSLVGVAGDEKVQMAVRVGKNPATYYS